MDTNINEASHILAPDAGAGAAARDCACGQQAGEGAIARSTMNGKEVIHRDAKSVLTSSDAFGHKRLSTSYVLNFGDACPFDCPFCYVGSAVAKYLAPVLGGRKHRDVVVRRGTAARPALDILRDNIGELSMARREFKHVVLASTLTDPAANMELVRETAAGVTMVFEETRWDVRILTKSSLLPQLVKLIPHQHWGRLILGFSTGTLDDNLAGVIEAGSARVSKRLRALRQLQADGFRVFGMICPTLPQNDYQGFSDAICEAIDIDRCETVWAEPLNVRGENLTLVIDALRNGGFHDEAARVQAVFAHGNGDGWEQYSQQLFTAHARNIGPEKLRFLHYPRKAALDWWKERQQHGAVLLGANAGEPDGEERPAEREQIVVEARPLGEAISAAIVPCTQLAQLGIPQRAPLLGDWFREGDYGMIVAPRGVGKTWMSLGLGVAIATGGSFGPWQAPAAHKTLIIDGEMPADELDRRIRGLGGDGNLLVLSHEALFNQGGRSLNLALQEDQQEMLGYVIEQGVKVLILDNLSCLVSGLRENDGDAWEGMKQWLLELRRRRVAVVLVHHAGRNGAARGTSKREDDLFWALSLEENDASGEVGARFKSTFTKNRNSPRDEHDLNWCFTPAERGVVEVTATPVASESLFRELVEGGETSASEIAKKLGVMKGTVSKWAKAGCAARWMHIDGRRYLPGPKPADPVSNATPIPGKQETAVAEAA